MMNGAGEEICLWHLHRVRDMEVDSESPMSHIVENLGSSLGECSLLLLPSRKSVHGALIP
jgi:hypothetical protein